MVLGVHDDDGMCGNMRRCWNIGDDVVNIQCCLFVIMVLVRCVDDDTNDDNMEHWTCLLSKFHFFLSKNIKNHQYYSLDYISGVFQRIDCTKMV